MWYQSNASNRASTQLRCDRIWDGCRIKPHRRPIMQIEELPSEIQSTVRELLTMANQINNIGTVALWYTDTLFPRAYEFRMWGKNIEPIAENTFIKFGSVPPYVKVSRIMLQLG